MNLLPIRSTSLHSDGAHIADARAGNERFARSVALIEIGRAQLEGRPIASLGDDVLARALRTADASLAAMRANSIAFRSMQITVPEAAAPFLEAALASSALATGGERTKLAVEALASCGRTRRDAAAVAIWRERLGEAPLTTFERMRVDVEVALARDDAPAAIAAIAAIEASLPGIDRMAAGVREPARRYAESMLTLIGLLFEPGDAPADCPTPSVET